MAKIALPLAASVAVILAGCGGDDSKSTTVASTTNKQDANVVPVTTVVPSDKHEAAPTNSEDPLRGEHSGEVLLGVVKGLLTETDDADLCELDGLSAVEIFGAAVDDFKNGKYINVADDLHTAFGKIDPLVSDCQRVQAEARQLATALQTLTPAEIQDNFKDHQTKIYQEQAKASKCIDIKDYDGYGKHMGSALRHVVVSTRTTTTTVAPPTPSPPAPSPPAPSPPTPSPPAPSPPTPSPPTPSPTPSESSTAVTSAKILGDFLGEEDDSILQGKNAPEVLLGLVKGLLTYDDSEVDPCEVDVKDAYQALQDVVADLKNGQPVALANDLSVAFGTVKPIAQDDCPPLKEKAQALQADLEQFTPDIGEANFHAHRTEILEERAKASEAKDDEDYEKYGQHLGYALRHVLVTESTTMSVVV